ncbi:HAD-IIB family hydrolase [bacterium]|nr:HAD-IIB family hydrolase [bacterium]
MPKPASEKITILLISIHGLIRGKNLELGRDADTGGQTKYVLELTKALARRPEVERVDLMTRRIIDEAVSDDYGQMIEPLSDNARIVRIECGPEGYIFKEALWDYLDIFRDNALQYIYKQEKPPDILHSHYADAGYVATRLSHQLEIPLIHTGHSLGRIKRKRLLASGVSGVDIEERYKMARRINAEEETLATAERVITSTSQEIHSQYAQYDYYNPDQMRMIPPGTDLEKFHHPDGTEFESTIYHRIKPFLNDPEKPMILALSRPDYRKNMHTLVEAYGESEKLQELANLVIVAGTRDDIKDLEPGSQEVLTELLLTIDRYDLYGKVAYPKYHSSDEVPVLYRLVALSRGIFVNPALTEPFGLTLIEATASGVPIVATEDGGPVDIIKNCQNGYLIDPLDKEQITDSVLKLLTEEKRWQAFSKNGLESIRRYYSWESHVATYLDLIRPIIDRSEPLERLPVGRRAILYHNGAIVSDIDQNLLGDKHALDSLIHILHENRKTIAFIIATGRRLDSALTVLRKFQIPQPDVLITSSGTEIYYAPNLIQDEAWANHIDYQWHKNYVFRLLSELPGLSLQPRTEQSAFKVSYYYDIQKGPSVDEIRGLLLQNEQNVNVIFSFGQFLDIVPVRASKGYAIHWISDLFDISLDHFLIAGGSGSDEDMMRGKTRSIVVANRHCEELSDLANTDSIYFSKEHFAAGILDGIRHYDFLTLCG